MKRSALLLSCLLSIMTALVAQSVSAQGDAGAGAGKVALCETCHGPAGNSLIPANPKLAGQNATYLIKQLSDYKSGARQDPTMSAMVAALSEQDIQDIAAYYSTQVIEVTGANPENLDLGQQLYRAGNAEINSAACTACHAPNGAGNAPAGFPALGGQHTEYTLAQLRAFRAGQRDNDLNSMMRTVVERLTDAELEALANYISGLH